MNIPQPSGDSYSPVTPSESSDNCPINCPNRRSKAKQPVLGGGYLFALIVAILLGMQCLDASYKRINGEEDFLFATKSPSSVILITGLTLIGLGLGIEIDKTMLSLGAKSILQGLLHSSNHEEK